MKETSIEVIKQTELLGHQFAVFGTPEEPLFKAKDVAECIEHPNITMMLKLVDDDEKGVKECLTPGGNQRVWFLTEAGLYEVLMQSRKPIAKQFKAGVKKILHEIRTTGSYSTSVTTSIANLSRKELAMMVVQAEEEKERLAAANEQKDKAIAKLQPLADFATAAFNSDTLISISQAAKILQLGFGRNTLFRKLREKGVFFANRNEPKQKYIDAKYFNLVEGKPIPRSGGSNLIPVTVYCTQKGLAYINHLFGGKRQTPQLAKIGEAKALPQPIGTAAIPASTTINNTNTQQQQA